MLLSDYTLPVPYDECRDLAIVYSYEIAVQWYQTQVEHGDPRHVAVGLPLPDGRWWLSGGVMSEVYPGGILAWAVDFLTPEIMSQIEVVPLSSLVAESTQEET